LNMAIGEFMAKGSQTAGCWPELIFQMLSQYFPAKEKIIRSYKEREIARGDFSIMLRLDVVFCLRQVLISPRFRFPA
jgi:hypothetical protein